LRFASLWCLRHDPVTWNAATHSPFRVVSDWCLLLLHQIVLTRYKQQSCFADLGQNSLPKIRLKILRQLIQTCRQM
jgi:hypothetical protein